MFNDGRGLLDASGGGSVVSKGAGLTEAEQRCTRRLLDVLERFRLVRQTIPVHLVTALLRVAADEGRSVTHYARDSGVSQTVMSRHLLDLGSQFRDGEPGLGLVDKRQSPHSLREWEVFLTPKGRAFIKQICHTLNT